MCTTRADEARRPQPFHPGSARLKHAWQNMDGSRPTRSGDLVAGVRSSPAMLMSFLCLSTISGMNATYVELATDWDRGQSGGPIYAEVPAQSQRVAVAIVSLNKVGRNVARRIDRVISDKLCEQVRMFPSTRFPTHECGQ
jgi:hypothetical protein